MLRIWEELSGPFYLDYVEGKFKHNTGNDLFGKFVEESERWVTGVWATKSPIIPVDATNSTLERIARRVYPKIRSRFAKFKSRKRKPVG